MYEISLSVSPTKTGFGPILFAGDLDEGIEMASSFNFNAVELSLLDSKKIEQDYIIGKIKDKNLKVFAISTGQTYYNDGYSLYDLKDDIREKAVNRIKDHVDFAAKLNSMIVIGGIRGVIDKESSSATQQKEMGKKAIKDCAVYAKDKNVMLLLEPINRYETNIINTVKEAMELIEEIGMDNIKILPDTFHMNIEEISIEDSLKKAGNLAGYIHFADSNRHAPGWGHTDFRKIISALKDIDYKGAIGVEILPVPNDYDATRQGITFLKKLLND